eukprot:SAG31_NODE_2364_length_5860_cov_11.314529_4_plen_315_part_00
MVHPGHFGNFDARNIRAAIPEGFTAPPLPDAEQGPGWVGGQHPVARSFGQGDASTVVARAKQANIGITVVSPLKGLMPRGRWGEGGCDAYAGNEDCTAACAAADGALRQWCIINPLDPRTFEQADALLQQPAMQATGGGGNICAGLKFHPEEHCYEIKEWGEELFRFAAKHSATVLVHSGDRHSAPMDYLPFADAHPEISLILAHLGNSGDMRPGAGGGDPTHQIRAVSASRHRNVYVDTSSAASINPGLVEYAVEKIGSDRILFGTDTPLYFAPMQRARIDYADISEADRANILRNTAAKLLKVDPTAGAAGL